jgi:hypothetical protein
MAGNPYGGSNPPGKKRNFTDIDQSRHDARSVTTKSRSAANNSVADDWDAIKEDVRLINEGYGETLPNGRIRINGRQYVGGGEGHIYPVGNGPGLHNLGKPEFEILGILNEYGVTHPDLPTFLAGYEQQHIDRVQSLWKLLNP